MVAPVAPWKALAVQAFLPAEAGDRLEGVGDRQAAQATRLAEREARPEEQGTRRQAWAALVRVVPLPPASPAHRGVAGDRANRRGRASAWESSWARAAARRWRAGPSSSRAASAD